MPLLIVNDVHSALNPTQVSRIERPQGVEDLCLLVKRAATSGDKLCIAGGRHAMGGQQFRAGGVLVDMGGMDRILGFDSVRGLLRMEAGALWPGVIAATAPADGGSSEGGRAWGIRQKQTGADALSLGGSVSCNAHGRGLGMGPLVEDVQALTVVMADGQAVSCSRTENPELFSLVVGGYGLFGIIADITLQLVERRVMRRLVDVLDIDDALNAVYRRAADGCAYGDFQYAIDSADESFLRRGVLACYRPLDLEHGKRPAGASPPSPDDQSADLSEKDWLELLRLAHVDKAKAFHLYAQHYVATHGRVYWSDSMQLGTYIPSYAEFLAKAGVGAESGATQARVPESLVITELFVPPPKLTEFMNRARVVLRGTGVEDIYGTIRAIRRDDTTFLPWAQQDFACVIFNLRTVHDKTGLSRSRETGKRLIDAAADLGGTFYLTYHRWASREQLLRCHPKLPDFLQHKRQLDPQGIFESDWYAHTAALVDGP